MSLKHDGLYAIAWECEYEKPIFDAENKKATPPNSPEVPVQTDLSTEKTWNTPGTAQVFPSNGRIMWRNRYVSLDGTWCGDKLKATEH